MNQTDKIKYFQRKGLSYSETALKLNLKVDSVKSFYFRHPADNTCLCCGEELSSSTAHRQRMFCSDKCRMTWWNSHRDAVNKKAYRTFTCEYCGKEFRVYATDTRKYCSRECYFKRGA